MSKEFEGLENENSEFCDEEDLEFFKNLFESQSSDIVLPKSLKAENLSKKYEKEIKLINKEAGEALKTSSEEEKKPNSIIYLFKKKGFAAVAACVAFAGFLFFTSDFAKDNILSPKENASGAEAANEKSAYSLKADTDGAASETAVCENEAESNKPASVNDGDIMTGGSDFTEGIDNRALDIELDSQKDNGDGRSMLSAAPRSKEARKQLEAADGSAPRGPVEISKNTFELNPLTGIDTERNAAKFLISNGAEGYVGNETIAEITNFSEKENKNGKNELFEGFLQRLY